MKCLRCQQENPPQAKFCLECAAPLALQCASCGTQLPPAAKFCFECATPVSQSASAARFVSPQNYTPKHLAERIMNSKAALEGERKQVTVLFADLKGSMELLADRDPEEARKILDPVLKLMMEAVHRYEGTVNQVMGDGIMALFGAPIAHEDHAVRACYAALRMQEVVKQHAERVRREEGVSIRMRVGLNSGEVVVRSIGNDLRMDYSAVGQTTHVAGRMEQLAEPGTALLTPATLALSRDSVRVKSLGAIRVKGLSEAIEVYELVGANAARSRLQADAARGLTQLVGRKSEMAQLGEALDVARAGRGQVVAAVGEPGVGKSRLFWEFAHSDRTNGCLVLEAASFSYAKATTFLPVIELLRGYFQLQLRDDTQTIREKVTARLSFQDRALAEALPAVLALFDVPIEDQEWARLDPLQRRQRHLEAVKHVLLHESQTQPLVLILEDLHWIDGATQAVLDGVVDALAASRVLLLINYRPEYQHRWSSKSYYRQLRLDALPPSGAEELLAKLLGTDPSLETLKRLLIIRTDGNPFFLEEIVRNLVETKALRGEAGAYRLTKTPESLQIPATIQAILAARIDRLEPEDKRLLQAASVIGKDVSLLLLEALADMPDEELRRRLALLQAAEFLYEARLFPEVEYTFKHQLTQEITYSGLLQERRRTLHARIVAAIEQMPGHRLDEQTERLAYHAVRGEEWFKAVTYLRQAGRRAAGRSAYQEAIECLEQALAALAHLPESQETVGLAIDLRLESQDSFGALGHNQRFLELLRQAELLATVLKDRHRLGYVLAVNGTYLRGTLQYERAIESAERALEMAIDLDDVNLQLIARYALGPTLMVLGDLVRARHHLRWIMDTLDPEIGKRLYREQKFRFGWSPTSILVGTRVYLVLTLGFLGEFAEGISLADQGIRLAEAEDHQYKRIVGATTLGTIYVIKGDLDRAIPLLEGSLALARTWNILTWLDVTSGTLAYAYALSERSNDAIRLLEESRAIVTKMRGDVSSSYVRQHGQACLLAGRFAEASEHAHQALHLACDRKQRGEEAQALRLLGEVAAYPDSVEPGLAEKYYRDGLTLASELGMRPLIAHCHLGLGKLYRRTGNREQAHEHITTATTMYRDMGMTFWLKEAEAEMSESGT